MVVGFGSKYFGSLISSSVVQTFAKFNKILHHLGSHVWPQLKHNSKRSLIINLNLTNNIREFRLWAKCAISACYLEIAVWPVGLGDCFLREGNSLHYGGRGAGLLGHVREGGSLLGLLRPHHLPLVRRGGAGVLILSSGRIRMCRGFLCCELRQLEEMSFRSKC